MSIEFIGYALDRRIRLRNMRRKNSQNPSASICFISRAGQCAISNRGMVVRVEALCLHPCARWIDEIVKQRYLPLPLDSGCAPHLNYSPWVKACFFKRIKYPLFLRFLYRLFGNVSDSLAFPQTWSFSHPKIEVKSEVGFSTRNFQSYHQRCLEFPKLSQEWRDSLQFFSGFNFFREKNSPLDFVVFW